MSSPLEPATTPAAVDQAVVNAHSAYLESLGCSVHERASWLTAVAEALRADATDLVELAVSETHLTPARLQGELTRTAFQLDLLAQEVAGGVILEATIDHADAGWGMGPRPDIRRVNVPLGVAGVFGASNFPFAFSVIGGDSASALAAGCAVLHKIHPGHGALALRTAELVIRTLLEAGAPEGLFGVVDGREAATALVEHPLVKAVGFTGSTAGGRALFDLAAGRPEPIPFFGELGSINPVFVLPHAWDNRAETILKGFAQSFTLGMGQFCTKPGILFVPTGGATDDVVPTLTSYLQDVPLGALLTPGLHDSFVASRDAVTQLDGVHTLVEGDDAEAPTPAVLTISAERVLEDPAVLHREMFGPATVLITYEDPADLPGIAELLQGQLTATVHGDEEDTPRALIDILTRKAGRVLYNGWPTGVTVSYAQHHGGPYPATTAPSTTSVGTASIGRFMRPVAYQDLPDAILPPPLQDANPWGIPRRIDGESPLIPSTADGTRYA